MPTAEEILLIAALAGVLFVGGKVVHGVKKASIKTSHAIVKVVTFGHHPKPAEKK